MKRWDVDAEGRWLRTNREKDLQEVMPDVDAFLEDVIEVCLKHGMSISHEDGHGAFIVENAKETNFAWLRAASVDRSEDVG